MGTILLTEEMKSRIPAIDMEDSDENKDPMFSFRLFTPDSNWTWYIFQISKYDNDLCFGYTQGNSNEWGSFSLTVLETIRGPLGLPIEVDILFEPTLFSQIKKEEEEA